MVMSQMKKAPGPIYATISGELQKGKGHGQTMTVWMERQCQNFEIGVITDLQ